jgi:hypothetical protein
VAHVHLAPAPVLLQKRDGTFYLALWLGTQTWDPGEQRGAATLLELGPPGGPVADGIYAMASKLSGRVLDVAYCGLDNGSNVLIWDWVGAPCQQWQLQHLGGGDYKILDVNSGRALDVAGCAAHDGANVQVWDYWGGGCQRWRIEDAGDGSYRLLAVNSGKALDVAGCSADQGANVQIWWYTGADCQRWLLRRLG